MIGSVFVLAVAACLSLVNGEDFKPYQNYITTPVSVHTRTVTVTATEVHTVRSTTTRDVSVTETTVVNVPVTVFVTVRDFVAEQPNTVTSVVRVTTTDLEVKTVVAGDYRVRTVLSVLTNFVPTTETVQLVESITHFNVETQVDTVPVQITENIQQNIVLTTTQLIPTTITSTTGYYNY
ncbi:uncharacterized protein LOC121857446 [Homarus americanus]|uniref:uncharacterized protein LOC121857446 n=1 Tax=Homarus americanus TaxID=6706 RepID=UPI001C45E9B8|nr:uncharacterized protein LOC121857446 [Homarus americanus]